MKKIIFMDIDGTIINNNGHSSKRILEAFDRVKSIGYELVLCTGNSLNHTKKINDIIKASRYFICDNGAMIYDNIEEKTLYLNPMDNDSIIDLYGIVRPYGVIFELATNGNRYANKITEKNSTSLKFNDLNKFIKENEILQVTIASPNIELIRNIRNKTKSVQKVAISNQSIVLVDENFIKEAIIYFDLANETTSKGNGIKRFCEMFNIKKEDTICIGDGPNDISMFKECGYKVSMSNAILDIKEMADYITGSNEKEGVAKFLEDLYENNL